MSNIPRPSKRPMRTTKSGEHRAVEAYRNKLESIAGVTVDVTEQLDRDLDDFLNSVRTPVPPAPDPEPKDPT